MAFSILRGRERERKMIIKKLNYDFLIKKKTHTGKWILAEKYVI